jgi:hypothetical protein
MSKPYKMKGHELPGPNQRTEAGDSPLESFDWAAAVAGGAKGAKMGSMVGPWGTAIGGIGMGLMAGFKGGKENDEAEAAEALAIKTEEEKDELLLQAKKSLEQEQVGYNDTKT